MNNRQGKISSKNGSTPNKLQQKQNLLRMIAHISNSIILKIAPRHHGHYDAIDVYVQDNAKKIWEVLLYL